MKKNKIYLSLAAICSPMALWAASSNTSGTWAPDINVMLLIIAALLVVPVYYSSRAFIQTLKERLKKETNKGIITSAIIAITLLSSHPLFAQAATASAPSAIEPIADARNWMTIILLLIIILEVLIIVYFSYKTSNLVNKQSVATGESAVEEESAIESIWNKMNSFVPKGKEDSIDVGHNYDGIRELDNITPPWFTVSFVASIIFAAIYMYRYHVAESAPLMIEEYNIEMAAANAAKASNASNEAEITAETVTMLAAADIDKGKLLFTANCVSCHGPNAASSPNGVGPNLTDEYWIHGGSIKNVFHSISDGWPEKGMISWKSQLSSKQIAQITSYVMSVKGSVSSGGKEPQGEVYKEAVAPAASDTNSVTIDTLKK